ncbi:MAG: LolA family protein [Verrucomicrobiales bacterium]|nr:LolA family protein [Verrucomicrobiales bacterium]
MKPFTRLGVIAVLFTMFSNFAHAEDLAPAVVKWLEAQSKIHTWTADFTQTRTLKSLTQPLTARGKISFAEPNQFRWELGSPAQTIAVRAPQELLILYPRLKRVERFSLAGQQTGQWRDALALLEAGFPRSRTALEAQYNILSQRFDGDICRLSLQPKSVAARRMMPQIEVDFDTKENLLRGTELEFADGSTMRNDFSNIVTNPKIDQRLFSPPIPDNYKVIEPMKHR